jgi:hypothetical protein
VCSDACAVCEGKKTRDGACPDCNGAGKLSCLLCAPPAASCAACAGKATAACAACKGAGHVLDVCAECAGRGQLPCGFCVGTAKAACEACFGSGKDVVAGMSKSGPAPDCAACKAKGVKTCPICQKGWTACKPCSGTKRSDGPCARCSGGKTVACRSCGDAVVRTLELEGLKAGKEGRKDAGIVLLERAAKAAAEQSERAADAVIAADQAATEKIKEMDRGGGDIRSRFDRTGAARRAVLASLAAAARAESCRAAEKRIQGELAAAETAAPALPSGGK